MIRGISARILKGIYSKSEWRIYRKILAHGRESGIETDMQYRELKPVGFDELVASRYEKATSFPRRILGRYRRGEVCYGNFRDGIPVSFGWVSPDRLELDARLVLDVPGSLGLYDFSTQDSHRGKGYYTELLKGISEIGADASQSSALIAVDPGNIPSIRGIEKAGYSLVGVVARRTWLCFTKVTSTVE